MIVASVFLISLSLLGYEVVLVRAFSISSWSHFAYMAISLALLGFGASGTFISLTRRYLRGRLRLVFFLGAALYAVSLGICFRAVQWAPFVPLRLTHDPRQYVYLLEFYGLLFVPFFVGAVCVGLSFFYDTSRIHRYYAANLLGSGAGALCAVGMLYVLSPGPVVTGLMCIAGAGAAIAGASLPRRRITAVTAIVSIIVILGLMLPQSLNISPYKGLPLALKVPGADIVAERSSPYGMLSLVESPSLRYAPGLSLVYEGLVPVQEGLFVDAGSQSPVVRGSPGRPELAYLDYTTSALPYHLGTSGRVLVLGAGGGRDVQTALGNGAERVVAVEVNPQIPNILEHGTSGTATAYDHPHVETVVAEARGYLETSREHYDIVQLSLVESSSAAAAGVRALTESYLYTREAFGCMLARLTPEGRIAVTRWLRSPARDGIRLFATAVEALEQRGVADPGEHLALIRNWNTFTLIISARPLSQVAVEELRQFCRSRRFDLAWYPGIAPDEPNRYHLLDEPWYYQACRRILGDRRNHFYRDYAFQVRPATDDAPYFSHFFKWRALPHIIATAGREWMPFVEWGYVVLIATLIQAALLSAVLILLPLRVLRTERIARGTRLRLFMYFLLLGMGYMFLELSFVQRFILFLHTPVYAVAVVVCGFLLFSGCGSLASGRLRLGPVSGITLAAAGIAALALGYLAGLGPLFSALSRTPDWMRISVSLALIAPLAFFMGVPFPSGLRGVAGRYPHYLPWAWGVNGCFSVIGTVLATMVAVSAGFTVVTVMAVGGYAVCGVLAAGGNSALNPRS